jgi:transposase InsO family protein
VLKFSKQAYYRWLAQPVSDRDWNDAHVINSALAVHRDDPEFGYRFIADELNDAGVVVSERRVWRLCSQQQMWSVFSKKPGLSRKAGPPVHDDLVLRDFNADTADQVWLTDITEHSTREGKLYVCAIKDVFSNRIVGYSINDRMTSHLAVNAVTHAVITRRPYGTIIHSDRGSQFRSTHFVRTLKHNNLVGSMGRVGACGDNAAMESFFALLQKNVLNRANMGHQRRTTASDHHLDRKDLPPETATTWTRPHDPDRVRNSTCQQESGMTLQKWTVN